MTATSNILPTYQRAGMQAQFLRRSFRPKEKYVILLVVFTFGLVCFGTFFFLPEFRAGNTSSMAAEGVYRVYDQFKRAGPELLIPPPPHMERDLGSVMRHDHHDTQMDPHVIDDREKLKAKIEMDMGLKVLERPDIEGVKSRSSSTSKVEVINPLDEVLGRGPDGDGVQESPVVTIPPAFSDHYPVVIGGEDPDAEVRKKRDKVKEVNILFNLFVDYIHRYCNLRRTKKKALRKSFVLMLDLNSFEFRKLFDAKVEGLIKFLSLHEQNYSIEFLLIYFLPQSCFPGADRFIG